MNACACVCVFAGVRMAVDGEAHNQLSAVWNDFHEQPPKMWIASNDYVTHGPM